MTSLREIARPLGRRRDLLEEFLLRLEPRVLALREGHFDVAGWHDRQVTTGRLVRLGGHGRRAAQEVLAVGVDGASGALIVRRPGGRAGARGALRRGRWGPAGRRPAGVTP